MRWLSLCVLRTSFIPFPASNADQHGMHVPQLYLTELDHTEDGAATSVLWKDDAKYGMKYLTWQLYAPGTM